MGFFTATASTWLDFQAFLAFCQLTARSTPSTNRAICQVHRARLRTGREVAVKVQRPNVERRLMSDISVTLAEQAGGMGPTPQRFKIEPQKWPYL